MTFLHTQDDPMKYTKGSVFWAKLLPWENSSVLIKKRPVVVVSSLQGSMTSNVVTVCPLTTKLKDISVNVDIDFSIDGRKSQVCCSQITTLPKYALQNYAGEMSPEDIDRVSQGILVALGLQNLTVKDIAKAHDEKEQLRKQKEELQNLLPQAKAMIEKLAAAVSNATCSLEKVSHRAAPQRVSAPQVPAATKRQYLKRTPQEVKDFIREWEDPCNDKAEVAKVFGFSTKGTASTFYKRHTEA